MRTMDGLHLEPTEVQQLDQLLTALVQRSGATPSAAAASLIRDIRYASTRFAERNRSVAGTSSVQRGEVGPPLPHDLLTTADAAAILGIGAAGVRQLLRRGTLTGYRAGGRWLVTAADVVRRSERR